MANICLIGINYAPEPIGIGPYTQGWAEALAARGHGVAVICGVPYYPSWSPMAGEWHPFRWRRENGIEVMRVPHAIPARPTTAGRLRQQTSFAANVRRALAAQGDKLSPDAVIYVAPVLLGAAVAARFARHHGALSWIHVHDFEVEAAVATGLLPSWTGHLAQGLEGSILRRFDRASSISAKMVQTLDAKRAPTTAASELRNWADPEVGRQAAAGDTMRAQLQLPACTLALYSGNLARKQGIDLIVETARAMQSRDDIAFVICGDGPAADKVAGDADTLANLHFRPLQPRESLPDLLAMADIHLLPQIAGAADLVLPSKLANMLASGRPVVATAAAGTSLAQEVEGCGVVVAPGDAGAFAAAVTRLADDPSERARLGKAATERAAERWSKDVLVGDFVDAIEAALAERRA